MKVRLAPFTLITLLATLLAWPYSPSNAAMTGGFTVAQQSAIVAAAKRELALFGGRAPIPGVLIGIWAPGKTFIRSVGFSDLATRKPFATDDRFRVGSNTKTFVVSTLLQLADEKRLKLDDPITKFHIGVTVPNGNRITVRLLTEMRSGLFEAYNTPQFSKLPNSPQTQVAPRTLIRWAAAKSPVFSPNARWMYCNTNYLILGLIIEAVTHDTVQHQIQTRFLTPLGLTNTTFPTTDPNMPKPYAHGYGLDKNRNWTDVSVDLSPTISWSAGAMISTMPDMKRWVKAYVTGAVNSKASQKARLSCIPIGDDDMRFGMGIGCSAGWYGYTGGIPGYHTAAYYMPAKDVTVIAFVNSQQERPKWGTANAIVHEIARILFPKNVPFPDTAH